VIGSKRKGKKERGGSTSPLTYFTEHKEREEEKGREISISLHLSFFCSPGRKKVSKGKGKKKEWTYSLFP